MLKNTNKISKILPDYFVKYLKKNCKNNNNREAWRAAVHGVAKSRLDTTQQLNKFTDEYVVYLYT